MTVDNEAFSYILDVSVTRMQCMETREIVCVFVSEEKRNRRGTVKNGVALFSPSATV